jgi:Ca2+-transporting ATPase
MSILVFVLQLLVVYVPALNSFFNVKPLSGQDLLIALGSAAVVFLAIEAEKVWKGKAVKK